MPWFVLEIGTEEIPARFLSRLTQDLRDLFASSLSEAGLDYVALTSAATPRRLTVEVVGLAAMQSYCEEIIIGPSADVAFDAAGNPTKAAIGFIRGQGMDISHIFRTTTGKGDYVAVRKMRGGVEAGNILSGICTKIVVKLPFPKRMRWGSGNFSFGRPIRWLLAMLDDCVVPFEIAGMASSNLTYGHRVFGPGPWSIYTASAYQEVVRNQGKVILNAVERRQIVLAVGDTLAQAAKGRVIWTDSLLDEVCNLVEWPRPLLGSFDPAYLELPREVLLTSMESHQKSFGIEDNSGNLMPHFLCVINFDPIDDQAEALVRKDWECVLKARLEDARFFWKTDLSYTMDQWQSRLEQVIFLTPLGSMADKGRRIAALCDWLADTLAPDQRADLVRAGELAKADLVSDMVGEFAELQGIMGGIYARHYGETEAVVQAIYEHYLPTGPDSPVPTTLVAALLAVADKADTMAGCFCLNMIPTGAADPYAMRRTVLGICRIILEYDLQLDVQELFFRALSGYGERCRKLTPDVALKKLMFFLTQRLTSFFCGQGYETLVVEAAVRADVTDIRRLRLRLKALAVMSRDPNFTQAILTFKRAANIIRKQTDIEDLDGHWKSALLAEVPDKALATALENLAQNFVQLWKADDFLSLFSFLRQLQPTVDAFFNGVMVMCDDPALRRNRLDLLKFFTDYLVRLADFNVMQI
ncbi:Glycine--tRNA ligase beta subunit [Desulfovibrionales bacterium]